MGSGEVRATLKKAAVYGVDSVAFSPDGKILASGIGGSGVKLWDVGTQKVTTLRDEVSQYASPLVLFSPDGKTLASGGRCMQKIRLWDVTSGKQTVALEGHDHYGVKALAFTPDGKTLASVGHWASVKLWDLATARNVATRMTVKWTPAAAFSPDGKTLATAVCVVNEIKGRNVVTDKCIRLWDVATGKQQMALKGHRDVVSAVVFSPDGKTVATGSEDHTIKLWDVATGNEIAILNGHTDEVVALVYSRDGKTLASGSKDKTIKLWEVLK
jgi:WD40 repeat protein